MSIRTILPFDPEWPPRLQELDAETRPERLYATGTPLRAGTRAVAVVGSRRPTATGLAIAAEIGRGLAEAGLPVVSGLAIGIDAAAHQAALDAGGYTIAVLGCGLDINYPRRNERLKRQIEKEGTLISEYEVGVEPKRGHFPLRNRVIAGMSDAVVLVEGSARSGGLITARLALDMNRHVFAVPGSTRNPLAAGPNELIRTAQATLVTGVHQILEDIVPGMVWGEPGDGEQCMGQPLANPTEAALLLFLDDAPMSLDRICAGLGLTFGEVAIALAALEVRSYVVRSVAGYAVTGAGARARMAMGVDDEERAS
ncbi:MAG TPA: DNA-processing protein DprA [Actinomycetota bacterium]|nr:DNA-processing protein DprA [Actinomycetota bacterium]